MFLWCWHHRSGCLGAGDGRNRERLKRGTQFLEVTNVDHTAFYNWFAEGRSFFKYYLFLVALDLCCCPGFSVVSVSGGYSLGAVLRLLIEVASLIPKHKLKGVLLSVVMAHRLFLHSPWNLPGPNPDHLIGRWILIHLDTREVLG